VRWIAIAIVVALPALAGADPHPKLSLANGHAKLACVACHDRGAGKPPSKGSTCRSCHAPVHVAQFGTQCESCHASIEWVGLPASVGRDNHAKTRYPLAGKHAGVACAACHPASKPLARRFRGVEFAACMSCHEDVHRGEYTAIGKGECAKCHAVTGFTPTLFGIAEHAKTKLPLDGKHAATPCGGCHTNPRPRLNMGVGFTECLDCHADPHGNEFTPEQRRGGCAQCHTAVDWHQTKLEHSTWPLAGAHARTACAACHGKQKKGAEPAAFRGIPRDCEGCHDDVHAGQFRQSQPRDSCKTCHDAETFAIAQRFDHARTRYPLGGAHKPLACASCHPTATLRDGTTSVRWRLGYARCKDCHANPHVDDKPRRAQVRGSSLAMRRIVGEMDCSACHADASWQLGQHAGTSGFDHDRTGFALRGAHQQARCAGCHEDRAKPPTSCDGCHRGPHQGRHTEPCAECHRATAWSDRAVLEQHRRTRMPLTGRHALVDCADCHKRQAERVYSDTPSDCYACHRAGYHDPNVRPIHDGSAGTAPLDRNCALCHLTTGWSPATAQPVLRESVPPQHDASFVLSTGSHRATASECASCHVDVRRPRLVRCDGCHVVARVRAQHRQPIAMVASGCLRCHVRGAAR
jgi:hypothetical protein